MQQFNPFISIPGWLSFFLKAYYLLYRVVLPLYSTLLNMNEDGVILFTLLNIVYSTLFFLPVLMPFKNIGIIHPLIFILLFSLLKSTVSNSGLNFIAPFFVSDFSFGSSAAFSSQDVYNYDLVLLNLKARMFDVLSLVMFYLGYFSVSNQAPKITIPRFRVPVIFSSIKSIIPIVSIVCILLLFAFFSSQGGITAYISSWGTSRKEALSELGVGLSFLKRIYIFPLIWFIVNGAKIKGNLLLMVIIAFTVISGFFLVGSRSGIVLAVMPFFLMLMIKQRKIPIIRPAIIGLGFLVIFGVLGRFRASTYDNQVNWNILTNINISESIASSEEELGLWQGLNADIAIYAKVPDQASYLFGTPYLGALLFFVPRSIWADKPHGTGYYVGRYIFGLSQAGIPPSETAEAYYNFGFLGILFIFFLKGRVYKLVVNRIRKYGLTDDIYFLIAYIIFIMNFNFTVLSLVNYLQMLLFLIGAKTILGPYNATQSIYPWLAKMRYKQFVQRFRESPSNTGN